MSKEASMEPNMEALVNLPTGNIQSMWECKDRNGDAYVKMLQFGDLAEVEEHSTQINHIFNMLQGHAEVGHEYFTGDPQWVAYLSSGLVILDSLNDHIDQWGMARIPGNVRLAVHGLQAKLGRQLTNFGRDTHVIMGAPYNGRGP